MSARANITMADGETSPVTHTFTPDGDIAEGVARYVNRNTTTPAASETFTLSIRDSTSSPEDFSTPGKKVSPRKVEFRLRQPLTYVDAVSGLTLVDFVNEAIVTLNLHPRTSSQQAKNVRKMIEDVMDGKANVTDAIETGEKVW